MAIQYGLLCKEKKIWLSSRTRLTGDKGQSIKAALEQHASLPCVLRWTPHFMEARWIVFDLEHLDTRMVV